MHISNKCVHLVKHFESLYTRAYLCPAHVWTIGYGHTGSVDGVPVQKGMIITEEKAIELFKKDMEVFERYVDRLIDVPLTQDQFDALVSFTFNVGAEALRSSTLRRLLNQKKYEEVPAQLLRWNKSKGRVLAGLIRRRKSEATLWSEGILKYHF